MPGASRAERVHDTPHLFMRGLHPARTFARIPSLTAGLKGKARQRAIETLAAKYCTPSRSQSQSSGPFETLETRRFDVIIDDDNQNVHSMDYYDNVLPALVPSIAHYRELLAGKEGNRKLFDPRLVGNNGQQKDGSI